MGHLTHKDPLLVQVAAVDEPQVHLWETGITRITRHPQNTGQLIWCLAHLLWMGNSFVLTTSAALVAHHVFACYHGDFRLERKHGKVCRLLRLGVSLLRFICRTDEKCVSSNASCCCVFCVVLMPAEGCFNVCWQSNTLFILSGERHICRMQRYMPSACSAILTCQLPQHAEHQLVHAYTVYTAPATATSSCNMMALVSKCAMVPASCQ